MSRAVKVAAIIWSLTALASRLLGLVRESVIGRTLGDSSQADAYWASFVIPDFLNYLLASGLLSIVFIPLFQKHLTEGLSSDDGESEAWRSFSALFTVVGAVIISATVALWFATPAIVSVAFDKLAAEDQALVVVLTRIVLPAQIFHVLGGLLSATLQARDKHLLPALAPIIYVGAVIIGGAVFQSAMGFAWGVLIGAVLGPFGLVFVGAIRSGMRLRPRLRHPDVRTWLVRSLPVMLGASVVVVDDWIVKHYAAGMGEGSIARLQYGRTLMKVPMGIFGMAAGLAAFPSLSRLFTQGKRAEARAMLTQSLRAMWVLAFATQAALTVAGTEIATVIWGTARFTVAEHAQIGLYTAVFCLGLWAWSGALLFARGFYAQGRTWPPTIIGTLTTLGCLPIYSALGDAYGGVGLAFASSIAISVYVIALSTWAMVSMGPGDGFASALFRLIGACAIGIAAGWGLDQVLPAWPPLLRGALTGGLAATVCLGLSVAFKVPEAEMMIGKVMGKLRSRRAKS